MTALEKLAFQLNLADPHGADEFFDTFKWKCPEDVFSDARTCDSCDTFHTCIRCWLQEVDHDGSEGQVDAEPVRHGHWIVHVRHEHWIVHENKWESTNECSECHAEGKIDGNYCPNCGAKMDEVSEWR